MKNKKYPSASVFLSAMLFFFFAGTQSAQSAEYYFDLAAFNSLGSQINLSQSLSYTDSETGQTRYFWFSDAAMTNPLDSLPDFSNPENSYIFTSDEGYSAGRIIIDTEFNAARIYSADVNKNVYFQAASSDTKINIGTVDHGNAYDMGFKGRDTSATVENVSANGNGIFYFGNVENPIKSFEVTGTFYAKGHGANGYWVTMYAGGVENHGIDNPDGKINILTANISAADPVSRNMLTYGLSSSWFPTRANINETSYVRINSITGQAGLWVGGATTSTGKLTVILAATDTFSETIGNIWEGYYSYTEGEHVYSYKDGGAQLALVMRSSVELEGGGYQYLNNTQSFTGEQIFFTGGVQMISGTLLINYKAANSGEGKTHGNLVLSKAAGAQAAAFGNNSSTVGGTFVFTNLEVTDGGGTIRVRLDYNDEADGLICDTLAFTGSATGSGTVLIDLSAIGGNPDDYIAFMIANDVELKIISWESAADANITFAATDGYKVYNYNGEDYLFTAKNLSDGLYVSYVVVPEPAEWAAILGLAAIALVVLRRRRK